MKYKRTAYCIMMMLQWLRRALHLHLHLYLHLYLHLCKHLHLHLRSACMWRHRCWHALLQRFLQQVQVHCRWAHISVLYRDASPPLLS